MTETEWLAERFEADRPRLRAVAHRMLGSASEADDALQEAWLKVSRSGLGGVDNVGGWLTTVVARVCLDLLRRRRTRREDPLESAAPAAAAADPARAAELADGVGQALLIVLETLEPDERLAFVLHDMFDVPFSEIGPIVGRTPEAARQLASRARRRVRGARGGDDLERRREVVTAFLLAAREGRFEALLQLLAPDATLTADEAAIAIGVAPLVRGGRAVAETFSGRALGAETALIDGLPGLVWSPGGRPRVVFRFEIQDGQVTAITMLADRARIGELQVAPLSP